MKKIAVVVTVFLAFSGFANDLDSEVNREREVQSLAEQTKIQQAEFVEAQEKMEKRYHELRRLYKKDNIGN